MWDFFKNGKIKKNIKNKLFYYQSFILKHFRL